MLLLPLSSSSNGTASSATGFNLLLFCCSSHSPFFATRASLALLHKPLSSFASQDLLLLYFLCHSLLLLLLFLQLSFGSRVNFLLLQLVPVSSVSAAASREEKQLSSSSVEAASSSSSVEAASSSFQVAFVFLFG